MMHENKDIEQLTHDARGSLNRISMQAELIKLVLENDMSKEQALEATIKIISTCQDFSQSLEQLSTIINTKL